MAFVLDGAALTAADASEIGSKAARLIQLASRGHRVPPFFVVTTQAFDVSRDRVPDGVSSEITDAYRRNFDRRRSVAVRSSATVEDGAEVSFAGQFESVLGVVGEDALLEAVRRCWASASSPRVAAYRRLHNVTDAARVAVIVQELVEPRAAGVLFTVDPVSSSHDVAIVSAVAGLGATLAAGASDGETYRVHKDAPGQGLQPDGLLRVDDLRALVSVGVSIEREAGSAQDIEWALDDEGVVILQSRPITTDGRRGRVVWDNSNIVESYPGITLPLTFSLAREAYAAVYRQSAELAGVPRRLIEEHAEAYEHMIGLVRGRVYYNLNSWYTALSLLPGFKYNRAFMEQMMGVGESLAWPSRPLLASPTELMRIGRFFVRALALAATIDRRVRRFQHDVDATCYAYEAIDFDALDVPALVRTADRLSGTLHEQWRTPIVNDFLTMVFSGLVRSLVDRWDLGEAGLESLLRADRPLPSLAPLHEIVSLASEVRERPELRRLFDARPDSELVATLLRADARDGFAGRVRAFLDRYGYRGPQELKLEVPSLREDPSPLVAAIRAHAERSADASRRRPGVEREQMLARVPAARRILLRGLAHQARRRLHDREAMRLQRGRAFGIARRIFTAAGRRLADAGRLDDPRDVFYLLVDELRDGGVDLRAAAIRRKQRFARYAEDVPPPERFETFGEVPDAGDGTGSPPPIGPGDLRGHGCSTGRVRGRAHVLDTPHGQPLEAGEILVARQTDPSWVTVFPLAAGILVERGSPLSHSAIVARELGIPTIVGVTGLTRVVATGDTLEMDGTRGVVRILT